MGIDAPQRTDCDESRGSLIIQNGSVSDRETEGDMESNNVTGYVHLLIHYTSKINAQLRQRICSVGYGLWRSSGGSRSRVTSYFLLV